MSLLTTLLFLAALGAAGYALLAALSRDAGTAPSSTAPSSTAPSSTAAFDGLDALFAAIALAMSAAGLLAVPLVQLRVFSLAWLAGLLGLVAVAALLRARQTGGLRLHAAPTPRAEWATVAALLLLSALLFSRPHEVILGGADAGVYVSLGVNMAETGALLIHEPLLESLDAADKAALLRELPPWEQVRFLRFPGFYLDDAQPGRVIPQFYTLHPLWLAVAYSVAGLPAALLMTPLWGVLGVWAVYMAARRLMGAAAWLPALLVLLTPLQLYFARYPTAEPIAQYFAWLGVWAFTGFVNGDRPRRMWGVLAALALSSMFLARIDMIFMLLLPLTWALYLVLSRRWSADELWFWAPLVITGIYAGVHGLVFSGPYTLGTYGVVFAFLRTQLWLLAVVGVPVLALLLYVGATQQARVHAWAARPAQSRWPRRLLAGVIVLAAGYAYFLRPLLGETIFAPYWYSATDIPLTDHLNLVRLGWYLGPLGLLLAVTGAVLAALRAPWRATWPLWIVGGSFTVFYIYNVLNNPFHIYAFRRYVPVAAPFLQLGAGYALLQLWTWRPRTVRGETGARAGARVGAALLGIALVATLLYNSRLIGRYVDDAGAVAQLAQLAAHFEEDAVLLFVDPTPVGLGAIFGTPLQYLHGFTAFDVQEEAVYPERLAAEAAGWQAEGRPVYVIVRNDLTGDVSLPVDVTALTAVADFAWHTTRLEQSYEHMPTTVVPVDYSMTIYRWMQPEP